MKLRVLNGKGYAEMMYWNACSSILVYIFLSVITLLFSIYCAL